MPKSLDLQHTFKYNWKDVFLASWLKYPSNLRPDIISVDIINKEFDPLTGILTSTRLFIAEKSIPFIFRAILPSSRMIFVEESKMDPKEKKMRLYSENISFESTLKTQEICTYTESKENSEWTHFDQITRVTCHILPIHGAIEDYIIHRFPSTSELGRDVMVSAIEKLKSLGKDSQTNT